MELVKLYSNETGARVHSTQFSCWKRWLLVTLHRMTLTGSWTLLLLVWLNNCESLPNRSPPSAALYLSRLYLRP